MTLRYLCFTDDQGRYRDYLTRFTLSKIQGEDVVHIDTQDTSKRYYSAVDLQVPYASGMIILKKYDDNDLLVSVESYSLTGMVFDFVIDTTKTQKYRLGKKGDKDFPSEGDSVVSAKS